jgi:hypothetical protein
MAIITIVFYPLFTKLEDWVKNISVRVIKSGSSVAGKFLGLTLTFIGGMLVLLYFYAKLWYHIDFISILFHGNIGKYM